jgi:hypothetical protein
MGLLLVFERGDTIYLLDGAPIQAEKRLAIFENPSSNEDETGER